MARPFTPLVNAEDAEKKLQGKIHKHWKDIQKQCRRCDPEDTGQLAQGEFKGKYGHADPYSNNISYIILRSQSVVEVADF